MVFYGLVAAIPKVFYLLCMSILGLIDVFQMLFRKLAGLDCYYVNETAKTGDLVYDFLVGIFTNQYPILSTVFWGLVILGVILLFLSTIIAIIRSEYTTEKADNGKGKIVGKALKSVAYFAIVPVVVLVGVYLGNVILVAVDSATTYNTNNYSALDTTKLQTVEVTTQRFGEQEKQQTYVTYTMFGWVNEEDKKPYGSTTTTFSGTIFRASAYNANRVRLTKDNSEDQNFAKMVNAGVLATNFSGLFSDTNNNYEKIATKIDTAFADNVVFAENVKCALTYSSGYVKDNNDYGLDPFAIGYDKNQVITNANLFNVQLVWYYYDLWHFNFIIAFGAAIICTTIFINLVFGLMRRIIEMIALFLAAPPLIGLMPLDNEKAYGQWRQKFIMTAVLAYGAVAGMNIIMLILPELQSITFFNNDALNWIVQTMLVIVALSLIKSMIGLFTSLSYDGGKFATDLNKSGEETAAAVGETAGKAAKLGVKGAGLIAGGAVTAGKLGVTALKGGYGLAKGAGTGAMGAMKAFRTRPGKEGKVDFWGTKKERLTHMGENKDKAFSDAVKTVMQPKFNEYKADNRDRIVEELTKKKKYEAMRYGTDHEKEVFEEKVNERLKKEFRHDMDKDEKSQMKEDLKSTYKNRYKARKAATQVTRKEVYDRSTFSKWKNDPSHKKLSSYVGDFGSGLKNSVKPVAGTAKGAIGSINSDIFGNKFSGEFKKNMALKDGLNDIKNSLNPSKK